MIEDFRSIYGDRLEEAALQMSLIGSLVQIGGLLGFWIVNAKDDGARAMRKAELAWWAATVERALHVWSPI